VPARFWPNMASRLSAEPGSGPGLTRDAFLGGRLFLNQPAKGYRAGVDPVLLAATIPAEAGERVLDLGCGAGAAVLCLGTRVPGLALFGAERQADYAALARQNAENAGMPLELAEADLAALPPGITGLQFHHVMANPPYFDRAASVSARDAGREGALGEDTPLATWVGVAAKRLLPKGTATFIHRAERVPDLVAAFAAHLGSVELWPLSPRAGRAARLVLIRGRKDGRAAFRLHAPLVLHAGDRHESDSEDYTDRVRAVLRDGADLPFPA